MKFKNLSKKKKIFLLVSFGVLSVLLWAFITASLITHDFNKKQLNSKDDEQQAIVHGIILTETKNEQKYWEIYGETGHWDSNNGVAQLDNVIGNFYKDNKVTMSLESSKGTYDSQKGDIMLYDNTRIALKDGVTLHTDSLHWLNSSSPIVGEGHVKIIKDNEFLSIADKITISPDYDSFKIEGKTVSKVYKGKK